MVVAVAARSRHASSWLMSVQDSTRWHISAGTERPRADSTRKKDQALAAVVTQVQPASQHGKHGQLRPSRVAHGSAGAGDRGRVDDERGHVESRVSGGDRLMWDRRHARIIARTTDIPSRRARATMNVTWTIAAAEESQ